MFLSPGSRMGGGKVGRHDFKPGTTMLFYNATAPLGWTKLTTQNDKALRVVSGSGGVSGGTNSFSTVMAQTVVGNTSLSLAQVALHTHGFLGGHALGVLDTSVAGANTVTAGAYTFTILSNSDSAGSGANHNHPITMGIQYIDLILASKS